MPTYLDLLPDDVLNIIYRYVHDRAMADTIKKAKRKMLPCRGHRTNSKVIWSWMNDKPWYSLNMRTDGQSIYSYHLEIGKTEDGEKVCLNYTASGLGCYSHTTSCHVGMCKTVADKIIST